VMACDGMESPLRTDANIFLNALTLGGHLTVISK